jgi:hypothetical protein
LSASFLITFLSPKLQHVLTYMFFIIADYGILLLLAMVLLVWTYYYHCHRHNHHCNGHHTNLNM